MKYLAFLYGFLLPFTSVFALSAWVNLPSLISLLALIFLMFKRVYRLRYFDAVVFVFFVLPVFFSALVNLKYAFEDKFLSHFLSYFLVFIAFYIIPRELLIRHAPVLLKGLVIGLFFSVLFAFAELIIGLTLGYDVLSSVPRFAVNEYDATFSLILRVRSFVEESGHYALYLGIITPLALIFMIKSYRKIYLLTLAFLVCVAMILTFSTSGIVSCVASAAIVLIMSQSSIKIKFIRIISLVLLILFIYFSLFVLFNLDLTDLIVDKIDDANGRLAPFQDSLFYFQNTGILQLFFGLGPGYYAYRGLDPVISLTALTIFQNGLIGIVFYVILFVAALKRIKKFNKDDKSFLMFPLIFSFLVYGGISNYWYPWFWFLLSILSVGPVAFNSSLPQQSHRP
jgi:hypothetical protein